MPGLLGLVDYSNPNSLGSRLRRRRSSHLKSLIDFIHARHGSVRILDLGGRRVYWAMFDESWLAARNVHVTLVNRADEVARMRQQARFTILAGDACHLPQFADNSFELSHSNSIIEHVGGWERMEAFARESRRLAPFCYLQTPYFWFPVEPHFLAPFYHWLPESWRAKILLRMKLGHYRRAADMGEAMRIIRGAILLDRAQLAHFMPDARIGFEWLGPLPKSLIAIRAAPAR
ncbi:MAG TPA: methyltransferase domain-containing protein [Rhizomicrobium sp.]|jgi:hypothetical protein|nr:methyltransferase domain-containing protein [Rhizomicrobium sp.]